MDNIIFYTAPPVEATRGRLPRNGHQCHNVDQWQKSEHDTSSVSPSAQRIPAVVGEPQAILAKNSISSPDLQPASQLRSHLEHFEDPISAASPTLDIRPVAEHVSMPANGALHPALGFSASLASCLPSKMPSPPMADPVRDHALPASVHLLENTESMSDRSNGSNSLSGEPPFLARLLPNDNDDGVAACGTTIGTASPPFDVCSESKGRLSSEANELTESDDERPLIPRRRRKPPYKLDAAPLSPASRLSSCEPTPEVVQSLRRQARVCPSRCFKREKRTSAHLRSGTVRRGRRDTAKERGDAHTIGRSLPFGTREQLTWAVDRIISSMRQRGQLFYKVRWEDSWEPAESLQGCGDKAVAEYYLEKSKSCLSPANESE